MERTAAILLAAGQGRRLGAGMRKQYLELGGRPLMVYALQAFAESGIDDLILVVPPGDENFVRDSIVDRYGISRVAAIVPGGRERYHSVWNGLERARASSYVLIHDLARPFVTGDIIARALLGAREYGAAVVGVHVRDTIRVADEAGFGAETPNRSALWAAQTPQAFETGLILQAYGELLAREEELLASGREISDDGQAVELFTDVRVRMIEGSYSNFKVTVPEDLAAAEAVLRAREASVGRYDG